MTEPVSRSVVVDRGTASEVNQARMAYLAQTRGLWVGLVVTGLAVGAFAGRRGSWGLGLTWGLLTVAVMLLLLGRAGAKATKAVYPIDTRVTARATPESLRMQAPAGEFTALWSSFSRVEIVRDHLILRPRGTQGTIVIPPALYGPDTLAYARAGVAGHPPVVPESAPEGPTLDDGKTAGPAETAAAVLGPGVAGTDEATDAADAATTETAGRTPRADRFMTVVDLTEADQRALATAYARWSVTRPSSLAFSAAALALAIVYGIVASGPGRWLPLVVIVVVALGTPLLAQRRTARLLAQQPAGRLTTTFGDHSFTRTTSAGSVTTEYAAVRRVIVSGDAVILTYTNRMTQLLPAAAIPEPFLGELRSASAAARH